ncbi:flagellar biosynthesis repressor FlbT [Pseudemcibacter aquimaris]|uniref:flagellar biosynthesis repressor FlbT n=1 Tax=Pseudemcibacter aquimaris TaxID=2857064 RepID=UPI00201325A5|nr:flagellar biosynthesis repressor FlbT [Pseudemcibacter aquimaris]MCC3860797.1 flagellar biosynthesis repressor FlbT [Pseudemcibacter aquimaris]WDU59617.1 flagellar biosynthesis repressor FlbT [Pseudemcibacter aquimaris]
MALKLSLKPGEKFVVNGAVIVNGDRRSTLVLQNKASLLREKDILLAEDVDTPVKHVYFPIMLMYMDPDGYKKYHEQFVLRMTEFLSVVEDAETKLLCVAISKDVMDGEFYKALMKCKKLFKYEQSRLAYEE